MPDSPLPRQIDLLDTIPQSHRHDPPASRQGAAIKAATAKNDRELVLAALDKAGIEGRTAHQIDREYAWASRSGSPAGKRLSELLRLNLGRADALRHPDTLVIRLQRKVQGCHVHVHRNHYDRTIHGEPC